MNILFIGNSFTFANDLEVKVQEMAAACGIAVQTARVAKGGYSLRQYADPATADGQLAREAILSRKWDYVVLQDHSLGPIRQRGAFFAAAKELCGLIRAQGAEPVFYQTWAYRPGSEKMASVGMPYEKMHEALRDAYRDAARENGTFAVPVGEAFRRLLALPSGPDPLWTVDDYHPCLCGTYLAAAVFCLRLIPGVRETDYCPAGNEPFSPVDAAICWQIARETCAFDGAVV